MCLTLPAQILQIRQNLAEIKDHCGQLKTVNIASLPDCQENDWILFSADIAIKKISSEEADELRELLSI